MIVDWTELDEALDEALVLWVQECDDFLSQWFGLHPIVGVNGFPMWPVRELYE